MTTQGVPLQLLANSTATVLAPAVLIAVLGPISVARLARFLRSSTTEAVQASDVVITMGRGDTCPFSGKRYLGWELPDRAGQGVDAVRPIGDRIEQLVRGLLAELEVPATA